MVPTGAQFSAVPFTSGKSPLTEAINGDPVSTWSKWMICRHYQQFLVFKIIWCLARGYWGIISIWINSKFELMERRLFVYCMKHNQMQNGSFRSLYSTTWWSAVRGRIVVCSWFVLALTYHQMKKGSRVAKRKLFLCFISYTSGIDLRSDFYSWQIRENLKPYFQTSNCRQLDLYGH